MKLLVKNIIIEFFRSRRFELVPHGHNLERKDDFATDYARDVHLQYLLNHLKINCVFDVGANQGQYATKLRQIGYKGYIISFEPVSETYSMLESLASNDPKWKTYKLALGSENKTDEINLFELSLLNSFLPVGEQNQQWDNVAQYMNSTKKEMVEIMKLDDIYHEVTKDIESECRTFIKLDTQGFDLEVVKGGQKTINKAMGLQSEISFIPIYEKMPNYVNSLQVFESLGFQVTGLYRITRDNRQLAAIEFDCMMASSKFNQF